MLQWMDGVLAKGDSVEFFQDEFRCPIYVKDLVNFILTLSSKWISGEISLISIFDILDLFFFFGLWLCLL